MFNKIIASIKSGMRLFYYFIKNMYRNRFLNGDKSVHRKKLDIYEILNVTWRSLILLFTCQMTMSGRNLRLRTGLCICNKREYHKRKKKTLNFLLYNVKIVSWCFFF